MTNFSINITLSMPYPILNNVKLNLVNQNFGCKSYTTVEAFSNNKTNKSIRRK